MSVVRQKRFHWEKNRNGFVYPTNYDVFHRPRRQEFEGYMVENGAFYISSKTELLKSKNRVSGNIKAVEMNEDTFFEIDEPSDWVIVEALMKKNGIVKELEEAKKIQRNSIPPIKMFLTDCGGCMTDGGMYYSEYGDEIKKFNARDGMGFALLRECGIITGMITSENVDLNRRRAEKLQLDILELGCKDKVAAVKRVCEERKIDLKNVAYIGDDLNDLEVIKMVGYGCCPIDAIVQVREIADYIAERRGGDGVIREVAEKIMQSEMSTI